MKEKEQKIKKLQAVKLRDDPRIGDGFDWTSGRLADRLCTAVIIIWQVQNGDPMAFRSSKTPDR